MGSLGAMRVSQIIRLGFREAFGISRHGPVPNFVMPPPPPAPVGPRPIAWRSMGRTPRTHPGTLPGPSLGPPLPVCLRPLSSFPVGRPGCRLQLRNQLRREFAARFRKRRCLRAVGEVALYISTECREITAKLIQLLYYFKNQTLNLKPLVRRVHGCRIARFRMSLRSELAVPLPTTPVVVPAVPAHPKPKSPNPPPPPPPRIGNPKFLTLRMVEGWRWQVFWLSQFRSGLYFGFLLLGTPPPPPLPPH